MATTCFGETAAILELDVLNQWEQSHKPLFIELTPKLVEEARQYLTETLGYDYEEVSRMSTKKIVELYLGG